MAEDKVGNQVQKKLWEISEVLSEAMVLLDPPNLPMKCSNHVTPQHAKNAYDLLLSIHQDDLHQYNHDAWVTSGDIVTTDIAHALSPQSALGIISDMYRAIILASSLLLEMCYWSNNTEYGTLTKPQAEILSNTIIKSIQSLKRIGRWARYSCHHKGTTNSSIAHKCTISQDWHDDYLPKSQYPLIQECFQREPLVDIQTNVVFGMQDRIVSLEETDYILHEDDVCHEASYDDLHQESSLRESNGGSHTEHDFYTNNKDSQDMDNVAILMNPKQLEKEELELLKIAAVTNTNTWKNGRIANAYKRRVPVVIENILHDLSKYNIYNCLSLPYGLGPCKILKSGCLIWKKEEHNVTMQQNVELYLFANGIMVLYPQDNSPGAGATAKDMEVYTITTHSTCTRVTMGLTFHFSISSIHVLHSKSKSSQLIFAVDETKGGSLKDGCEWMSQFQIAMENVIEFGH